MNNQCLMFQQGVEKIKRDIDHIGTRLDNQYCKNNFKWKILMWIRSEENGRLESKKSIDWHIGHTKYMQSQPLSSCPPHDFTPPHGSNEMHSSSNYWPPLAHHNKVKIKMTKFNVQDNTKLGWINNAKKYFESHCIQDNEKNSINEYGRTCVWFFHVAENPYNQYLC